MFCNYLDILDFIYTFAYISHKMPVKTKKREEPGKEGKVYFLTLDQIREFYYPKHISVAEIKAQTVGTTITVDCDTITILPEKVDRYHKPDNVS